VRPDGRGALLLRPVAADVASMRRKVQVARKQMALQDEDYRAILQRITGHESSTRCDARQLDAVLREFRRLGWKAGAKPPSHRAQIRMIHAVFADIRPMLGVPDPTALHRFVQRMTKTEAQPQGVDAPEFLTPEQAAKVLEGLKAWRTRLRQTANGITFGKGSVAR
jgi:phage gp16-like protein